MQYSRDNVMKWTCMAVKTTESLVFIGDVTAYRMLQNDNSQ